MKSWAYKVSARQGQEFGRPSSVYLDQGKLGALLGPRVAPESEVFIIPMSTYPGGV